MPGLGEMKTFAKSEIVYCIEKDTICIHLEANSGMFVSVELTSLGLNEAAELGEDNLSDAEEISYEDIEEMLADSLRKPEMSEEEQEALEWEHGDYLYHDMKENPEYYNDTWDDRDDWD